MAAAPPNAPLSSASVAALEVRPVSSLAEYAACVALQEQVWGEEFESVPASMLQVATYVGGLCLGAFTADGELCGFVFGLAGTIDGRPTHWSHLLGVRESARNLGVGRLLKEHQRDVLKSRGIPEMCWTFDPLIAKNAHLNLNLLGARVVRYVPDMYGTTESPLHHGLATDRLVVSCLTSPGAARRAAADVAGTPLLTPAPQNGDLLLDTNGTRPSSLRIEVPADFRQLLARSPAVATAWHAALRRHFKWALDAGYVVTGLHRDPLTSRSFYTLEAE
jgi:chorismate synthase